MYTQIFTNSKDGTTGYRAPESFSTAFDNQNPSLSTYKVDLWSLGVLIYYLYSFELPFGENLVEVEKRVFLPLLKEIDGPFELKVLINKLLKINPDERISYSQIK